jgi:polar amino acid transport system substrate-binding protein
MSRKISLTAFPVTSKQVSLMSTRLSLLFLAVVVMALSACGEATRSASVTHDILQEVMARKIIRIGVMADTPPFSYQVGKSWTGFDIEIAQGVANQLGIENVEFVPVTLDQRSDAAIKGTVDMVVASMTITRYREHSVDFSIPYFQDGMGLLVKSSSPIQSYLDLDKKTIGATKGSTSSFYMKQINPDAAVKIYADNAAMRTALDKGEVDAITTDYITLVGMVATAKDPASLRIAGNRLTAEPFGIAVAPNQSAWRNAINHALIALWEKQEWHASADTWFGPSSKYASPINFVMPVYPK